MKKGTLIFTIVLAALTIGASVSFAIDPTTQRSDGIKKEIINIERQQDEVIVQVGSSSITKKQFLKFKTYQKIDGQSHSDEELMKQMITDQLMQDFAKEKNINVTLEEGKQEANKMRTLLENQPADIQKIQAQLISSMGVSEDEYWSKIAPVEYQKQLVVQKITESFIKDATLQYLENDPSAYGEQLKEFRQKLYDSSQNKVKMLISIDSISKE